MSKKPIDFTQIDDGSKVYLENFAKLRIDIAKEDKRHAEVIKPLKKKLDAIYENRANDLAQKIPLDDVIRKHPTTETENAIRAENKLHKELSKPLRAQLNDTYALVPESMYESYIRKLEEGKRGAFMDNIEAFLRRIGVEEISQSALGKLAERMSDRIGVSVSTSKQVCEEGIFSSVLRPAQFCKLFLSIFCDILVKEEIIALVI